MPVTVSATPIEAAANTSGKRRETPAVAVEESLWIHLAGQ